MNNNDSKSFFKDLASKNPDQLSVKITPQSNFTEMDASFILRFADLNSDILDLASGTGLIINKINDSVRRIVAVELFKEFSDFIHRKSNVSVVNADIIDFDTDEKFDLITLFGVVQYFSEDETLKLYNKCISYLNSGGKVIIKGQFGVNGDVRVNGYSEELKKNYFSVYRFIEKETALLDQIGFRIVEKYDIYPPQCNRWTNTHFYALVCSA